MENQSRSTGLAVCALAVVATLAVTACTEQPDEPLFPAPQVCGGLPRQTAISVPDADRAELARDLATLTSASLAYAENDAAKGENFVFSPYEVAVGVAMGYSAARGQTAIGLATAAGFTMPASRLVPAMGALDLEVAPPVAGAPLTIARSFWVDKNKDYICSSFDTLGTIFGVDAHSVDFRGDPTGSISAINQWIAAKTGARVTNTYEDVYVNSYGMGYDIADAVVLDAPWALSFVEARDGAFVDATGTLRPTTFLHGGGTVGYAATDAYEAVDVPLGDGALSFLAIAPRATHLADIGATLDADGIGRIASALTPRELSIDLPRLHIPYRPVHFGPFLQQAGASRAFDVNHAEFAFMKDGSYLSDVVQQISLDIGVGGASGALATESLPGARVALAAPADVRIDRPFYFAIRHARTGTILFLGRVMTPTDDPPPLPVELK